MIYCYKCTDCGFTDEKNLTMNEYKKRFRCPECGKFMHRDIIAEQKGTRDIITNWPMQSDAAGVHPDQVPEAVAYAKKMGVPTDYNPETGNPIFTGRQHRRDFCRATGLFDRDAGYGDASPRNTIIKRRKKRRRRA